MDLEINGEAKIAVETMYGSELTIHEVILRHAD